MTKMKRLDERGFFFFRGKRKIIVNAIIWPDRPMCMQEAEQFAVLVGIENNLNTHLITEEEYKSFFPDGILEKIWLSGGAAKSNKGWLLQKGNYINIGIIVVADPA